MTYDQLQEGDEIFLDANTFIYHFLWRFSSFLGVVSNDMNNSWQFDGSA